MKERENAQTLKLEVVKRKRTSPDDVTAQRYFGRIIAGNGTKLWRTETMHNQADVDSAIDNLIAQIQTGNFKCVRASD